MLPAGTGSNSSDEATLCHFEEYHPKLQVQIFSHNSRNKRAHIRNYRSVAEAQVL